jgi:hypothetical protein
MRMNFEYHSNGMISKTQLIDYQCIENQRGATLLNDKSPAKQKLGNCAYKLASSN